VGAGFGWAGAGVSRFEGGEGAVIEKSKRSTSAIPAIAKGTARVSATPGRAPVLCADMR
jgi:hypothetical protein